MKEKVFQSYKDHLLDEKARKISSRQRAAVITSLRKQPTQFDHAKEKNLKKIAILGGKNVTFEP